ncbi:hypothetical protein EWM64_g8515 [Hericium alpestre]|uniref:SB domain-containing protein n=1 Tax=Hericium alpestre TaxID=135208 RepID=A0A4Y9ZPY5_9AGAM|nr:hypothetical protein EWM64_g8515 [Hericium alpestre]
MESKIKVNDATFYDTKTTTTLPVNEAGEHTILEVPLDEERRLLRKFDFLLLPPLSLMYLCNNLDRGNIGNAKTDGWDKVSVDELVCGMSIVHNQLVDLVAEDNAIEDTVYHLHRALNAGRTDLDRFLRTTRVLAEEQFMKRALAEKIQHGLGWA